MASPRSVSTRTTGLMKKLNDLHKLSGARGGLFIFHNGVLHTFLSDPDFFTFIKNRTLHQHSVLTPDDFDTVAARNGRGLHASDASSSDGSFTLASTPSSNQSISTLELEPPAVTTVATAPFLLRPMGSSPPSTPPATTFANDSIAINGIDPASGSMLPATLVAVSENARCASPKSNLATTRGITKRATQLRPRKALPKSQKDWF